MLQASMNKQLMGNMIPGGSASVPDWSQLTKKAYSPDIMNLIKKFFQTATGGIVLS